MVVEYYDFISEKTCQINEINGYESRLFLECKIKTKNIKKLLFICMNPSEANSVISDKTVNKCSKIAKYDLTDLEIGSFVITNVYPFFQPESKSLQKQLKEIKKISKAFYFEQIMNNLKMIYNYIDIADYIILSTGDVPNTIIDVEEYLFLVHSIHNYIESRNKNVYLPHSSADNSGYFFEKNNRHYSYHICPRGKIDAIKTIMEHQIIYGDFSPVENATDISIEKSTKKE